MMTQVKMKTSSGRIDKKITTMNDTDFGFENDFADFIDELENSEKNNNAQCSIDNPECESCCG